MYIILVTNRRDSYDRTWARRDSLEEAREVAKAYECDNSYTTEIYEIGKSLSSCSPTDKMAD